MPKTTQPKEATSTPHQAVIEMPRLVASDLSDVGHRVAGSGDPEGRGDGIQYDQHPDRGCYVHTSCLTCPLPECRLVDPVGYRRLLRERSQTDIVAAVREGGLSISETARRFRRSERTVSKILAEHRQCPQCHGDWSRVIHTKRQRGAAVVHRECRRCQHRWKTTEHDRSARSAP